MVAFDFGGEGSSTLSRTSWKLGIYRGLARTLCYGGNLVQFLFPRKRPMIPARPSLCFRDLVTAPMQSAPVGGCQGSTMLFAAFPVPCFLVGSDSPHPQRLLVIPEGGQTHPGKEHRLLLLWIRCYCGLRGQGIPAEDTRSACRVPRPPAICTEAVA